MRKLFLVIILLLAAGCASLQQSPQQFVFKAKQDYAVALTVAVAYKALPACGGVVVICSKPEVVARLQKVDIAAFALLDAAENTVRTDGAGANVQTAITAANQAVLAFTTITAALATK